MHTDDPERRFVPGAVFPTEPSERGPLTLRSVRVHQGTYLLAFDGHPDRTAAEALRGTRLLVTDDDPDVDDDGWREEDLLGFEVVWAAAGTPGGAARSAPVLPTPPAAARVDRSRGRPPRSRPSMRRDRSSRGWMHRGTPRTSRRT